MLKTHKHNLTKKEIGFNLNIKIGLSKKYSEKITDDFIEILRNYLKQNKLIVKNFGLFKVIKKKKRIGRNPKTKEEHIIKSRKSITFSTSKKINYNINNP